MKQFLIIILSATALYSMQSPEWQVSDNDQVAENVKNEFRSARFSQEDKECGISKCYFKRLYLDDNSGKDWVADLSYEILTDTLTSPKGHINFLSIGYAYRENTKDLELLLIIETMQEMIARYKKTDLVFTVNPNRVILPSYAKEIFERLGFVQNQDRASLWLTNPVMLGLAEIKKQIQSNNQNNRLRFENTEAGLIKHYSKTLSVNGESVGDLSYDILTDKLPLECTITNTTFPSACHSRFAKLLTIYTLQDMRKKYNVPYLNVFVKLNPYTEEAARCFQKLGFQGSGVSTSMRLTDGKMVQLQQMREKLEQKCKMKN